jgi:hypothetical protein
MRSTRKAARRRAGTAKRMNPGVPELGKLLLGVGVALALVGLFLWKLSGKFPLGRLPGDFYVQKPGMSFYFPLTTCVLLSLLLTLVMWLVRR